MIRVNLCVLDDSCMMLIASPCMRGLRAFVNENLCIPYQNRRVI